MIVLDKHLAHIDFFVIGGKCMSKCIVCGCEFNGGFFSFLSSVNACESCEGTIEEFIRRAEAAVKDEHINPEEQKCIIDIFESGNLKQFMQDCKEQENKFSEKISEISMMLLHKKFLEIAADKFLEETEWVEIQELIDRLGISTEAILTSSFGEDFRAFMILTQIERGLNEVDEMPVVDDPRMILQKNEICFVELPAELMEFKTKTSYVGGHSGVSIRLSKNVRWNTGTFKGEQVKEEVREITDTGFLAITNKRAAFVGDRKNVVYPLGKIINITKWPDAIAFQKENEEITKCFILNSEFAVDAMGLVANHFITGGEIPRFEPPVELAKSNKDESGVKLVSSDLNSKDEVFDLEEKNAKDTADFDSSNNVGIETISEMEEKSISLRDEAARGQTMPLGENDVRRSKDQATQILSGIATAAMEKLSTQTSKPTRKSKWAGTFADGRYYKIWYNNAPWENHAFSYQLHIYTDRGDQGLGVMFFFWTKDAKNKGISDSQIAFLAEKMKDYAAREGFEYKGSDEFHRLEKYFNQTEESGQGEATKCLQGLIEIITPIVESFNDSAG